jgi:hypothetical protein
LDSSEFDAAGIPRPSANKHKKNAAQMQEPLFFGHFGVLCAKQSHVGNSRDAEP